MSPTSLHYIGLGNDAMSISFLPSSQVFKVDAAIPTLIANSPTSTNDQNGTSKLNQTSYDVCKLIRNDSCYQKEKHASDNESSLDTGRRENRGAVKETA